MISILERLRYEAEKMFDKNMHYEACTTPEMREAFIDAYLNNTPIVVLLGLLDDSFERTGNSKTAQILKQIEEGFAQKLQEKTGWGRNDVLTAYKDVVLDVLRNQLP